MIFVNIKQPCKVIFCFVQLNHVLVNFAIIIDLHPHEAIISMNCKVYIFLIIFKVIF